MSARDPVAEALAESLPVKPTCGNCANAVPWRHGAVRCVFDKAWEYVSEKRACRFTPSRWIDDPYRREASMVLLVLSGLEARRMYLAPAEAERGKVDGEKLRAAVKVLWDAGVRPE